MVLIVLQAPRLGGLAADVAAPVFSPDRGFADFDLAYYPAAVAIRHEPEALYRGNPYQIDGGTATRYGRAYFVNLPLVAWLFVPLTSLPPAQAGLVLLALNIAITLACLVLVLGRMEHAPPWALWAVTLAFASSGPLQRALNMGQTTPLVLLALLLAERSLFKRTDVRAGLWLGLACVIKVPPLVCIPYLALRGRWRTVAAAAGLLVAIGAVSLACYGVSLHLQYIDRAFGSHTGAFVAAFGNQSLAALVARALSRADLLEFAPERASFAMQAWWWVGALGLSAGFIRTMALRGSPSRHLRLQLELGAALVLALIVLPIAWVHYGLWLLPVATVAGVVLIDPARANRGWAAALAAAVALINFPVLPPWLTARMHDALWFRMATSHQAIGQILLFLLCLAGVRHDSAARRHPTRPAKRCACARLRS